MTGGIDERPGASHDDERRLCVLALAAGFLLLAGATALMSALDGRRRLAFLTALVFKACVVTVLLGTSICHGLSMAIPTIEWLVCPLCNTKVEFTGPVENREGGLIWGPPRFPVCPVDRLVLNPQWLAPSDLTWVGGVVFTRRYQKIMSSGWWQDFQYGQAFNSLGAQQILSDEWVAAKLPPGSAQKDRYLFAPERTELDKLVNSDMQCSNPPGALEDKALRRLFKAVEATYRDPESGHLAITAVGKLQCMLLSKEQKELAADHLESLVVTAKDGRIREKAALTLRHLGLERVSPPLLACLEDPEMRLACAIALSSYRQVTALAPLSEYYAVEANRRNFGLVDALAALGGPAVKILAQGLYDRDEGWRSIAVAGLVRIGDQASLDALIEARDKGLVGDEPLVLVLERLDDPRREDLLMEMTSKTHSPASVRASALLAKLGSKKLYDKYLGDLRQKMPGGHFFDRSQADFLDKVNPKWREAERAQEKIRALLADLKNGEFPQRQAAIWALGAVREPLAIDPLLRISGQPDTNLHDDAIQALGMIGDSHVIPTLRHLLSISSDSRLRSQLIQVLAKLGDFEPLKNYLLESEAKGAFERFERSILLQSLAEKGDLVAVEPLISSLWSEAGERDRKMFNHMVSMLDKIERAWSMRNSVQALRKKALDSLKAAAPPDQPRLAHHGPSRRREILILGAMRDEQSVDTFIASLGDIEDEVRSAAYWALERLGHSATIPLVGALTSSDNVVREGALDALRGLHPGWSSESLSDGWQPMVRTIESKVHDRDWRVRSAAAWALGRVFPRRAILLLIESLRDAHWAVRLRAAEGLANLANVDNMPAIAFAPDGLAKALEDENVLVRDVAAWALWRLDNSNN